MEKKKRKRKEISRFGVSMPTYLLNVLDKLAETEDVTRSRMIQLLIKNAKK